MYNMFAIQMAATACLFNLSRSEIGQKLHPRLLGRIVSVDLVNPCSEFMLFEKCVKVTNYFSLSIERHGVVPATPAAAEERPPHHLHRSHPAGRELRPIPLLPPRPQLPLLLRRGVHEKDERRHHLNIGGAHFYAGWCINLVVF